MSELNNRPVCSITIDADTGVILAKQMPSFTDSNGTHYMGYTESRISSQDTVEYDLEGFTFSEVACGGQCHFIVWNGCDGYEVSDQEVHKPTQTFHPFLCVEVSKPEYFDCDGYEWDNNLFLTTDGRFFKAVV